jgi:hypothetical protein
MRQSPSSALFIDKFAHASRARLYRGLCGPGYRYSAVGLARFGMRETADWTVYGTPEVNPVLGMRETADWTVYGTPEVKPVARDAGDRRLDSLRYAGG